MSTQCHPAQLPSQQRLGDPSGTAPGLPEESRQKPSPCPSWVLPPLYLQWWAWTPPPPPGKCSYPWGTLVSPGHNTCGCVCRVLAELPDSGEQKCNSGGSTLRG